MPQPAFPGAEGFGSTTVHGSGRGMGGTTVIKVNRLADDTSAGSLRYALTRTYPRVIVFEKSGEIVVGSDLKIADPYCWVAGQTAPYPGIMIRHGGLRITSHDILVQHIRLRPGDESGGQGYENRDAFGIAYSGGGVYNVVMDHISGSWATDENASTWYALHDVTISNSIISEGLNSPLHPEGPHSKGLLLGDHSLNTAVLRCLLAHNVERHPLIKGDVTTVLVNNVFYNCANSTWTNLNDGAGSGSMKLTAIGNVYRTGPDSPGTMYPIRLWTSPSGTQVYETDNKAPVSILSSAIYDPRVGSPPLWDSSITTIPGSNALAYVLAHSGAWPALRDSVDSRIVTETTNRTGGIIVSQSEVGGWPSLAVNTATFNIPSNPDAVQPSGWTNLEEYIHSQYTTAVEGGGTTYTKAIGGSLQL